MPEFVHLPEDLGESLEEPSSTPKPEFVHLPEDLGESPEDLGLKPLSTQKHYPAVLSTEGTFVTINRAISFPEPIEETIFGYPIEDKRQIVFADTHSYGIDPNDWVIQYGSVDGNDIKKNELPSTSSNAISNDLFPYYKGVWNIGSQSIQDKYEGIVSYEDYGNSAIDLIIDSKYDIGSTARRYVTCATKQVFDCDVAANVFVSFGLKREHKNESCLSRCGIYSSETGWFIEISGSGAGDNFKVVRRYTDSRITTPNKTIDQVFYRSEFVDKLDGSGVSGHVIDFSYVTMFAIEIGSYDGSAVKFYAYIPDKRAGRHTWTMFHKIGISDTLNQFPERNASALPLTFFHSTTPLISGVSKLSKYGTSVTRVGASTAVIKMFSAAGQFKELIPFKESFIFGLLTKDSLNEKRNYTRHFPKYLTATANVPTELTIRRYRLNESNSSTIKLEPTVQEQYDSQNLLYVVDSLSGKISFISTTLQTLIKTVDCNARNILYVQKYDILYVATTISNAILAINGSTGDIIDSFLTNSSNAIDLAFSSVTINNVLQDRLIITNSSGFTVWNITDDTTNPRGFLSPLLIYSVTGLTVPLTAQVLAADNRFFVALQNDVNIYSATTTTAPSLESSFNNASSVLGIAYSQLKLFISLSSGSVSCLTRFSGSQYTNSSEFSFSHSLSNPDIIVAVDSVDIVYVASTTNSNVISKRNYASVVNTILTNAPSIGIVVDPNLNSLLYNSTQVVLELNSGGTFIDLTSANSFLKGNLLAAGITALVSKDGLAPVGDIVSNIVIGGGAKQIDLTHAFQEYREFFATSYDSFTNQIESQDLILFFLKHLGELLSKTTEQISWQANVGTSNFNIIATPTATNPLHIVNTGSGTLSVITGQN